MQPEREEERSVEREERRIRFLGGGLKFEGVGVGVGEGEGGEKGERVSV